ncbi:helix-turn-helix domain-containing protein [Streptomyces sp. N2-109]|uniref:Helix-turn-helix domain-containing protein n=1 Tax=Streptomyces gossypii TaxID=2883101 RepID=A0ABT2K301_9ACTN|nr:helix-turn-helix transcriptional regulator [Streptomyces gossypii]MCT2594555.1 helix-turn-helix domain-containing protein [Streptomyces gossypii]
MKQGTVGGASVVRRWQLAATLKSLREQADLTQERAVELLVRQPGRWSRPKLSRIENREHNVKPREVEQMLDAYGTSDAAIRQALVRLAADSHEPGWWVKFNNELPEDVRPLLSIEAGLVAQRDFQTMLVPGLLQTADYARAVFNAVHPGAYLPDELERSVAARMVRQRILDKEDPPQLHYILDQVILERVIGRPSVMRDQLHKLLDMAEDPNVTLQILPAACGGSPGLEGPFCILTLPDPIPDIGYAEGPAGSIYIEDREHVRACTLRFGILTEQALSRTDSVQAISEALRSYQ